MAISTSSALGARRATVSGTRPPVLDTAPRAAARSPPPRAAVAPAACSAVPPSRGIFSASGGGTGRPGVIRRRYPAQPDQGHSGRAGPHASSWLFTGRHGPGRVVGPLGEGSREERCGDAGDFQGRDLVGGRHAAAAVHRRRRRGADPEAREAEPEVLRRQEAAAVVKVPGGGSADGTGDVAG